MLNRIDEDTIQRAAHIGAHLAAYDAKVGCSAGDEVSSGDWRARFMEFYDHISEGAEFKESVPERPDQENKKYL